MKWDELKPEDRNRLVAIHVMGWQAKECDGEIGELPVSPDGWFCQRCGYSGSWGDDTTHEEIPPHYTQSMDRAWQVLNKIASRYSEQSQWLVDEQFEEFVEELCECSGNEIYPATKFFVRMATWTPEHICLIALKACGVEIE